MSHKTRLRLRGKGTFSLFSAAVVLSVFSIYSFVLPTIGHASATCQDIAVPAYSYPNPPTFWDGVIAATPPVSVIIANVNSGPGTTVDSNYTTVIGQAKAAGADVMGYVWTNYGASSTSSVEAQIDEWKSLYNVTGILFDGVSSNADEEGYYKTLVSYVHANGGKVMLNPGDVPDESYMNTGADIINIFEGDQTAYDSFTPPSWVYNYPASRFSNVIYDVSSEASMKTVLTKTQKDNAEHVYITDEGLPNPYSTLPSYWSSETAQITHNCSSLTDSGSGGGSSGSGSSHSSSSTSTPKTTTPSTKTSTKKSKATTTTPKKTTTPTTTQPKTITATLTPVSKSKAVTTSKSSADYVVWAAVPVIAVLGGVEARLIWRIRRSKNKQTLPRQ